MALDNTIAGLGVDLGATNIKIAVIDAEGEIHAHRSIPTQSYEGPERVAHRIAEASNEARAEYDAEVGVVGIGAPGLMDIEQGITRFCPNLGPDWDDFPLAAKVAEGTGMTTRLLNDVRAATLGELTYGHGREGDPTMVFMAIGTGLGGGVAIEGRLRLGPDGQAGELGHMTVEADGRVCGCGNRGCLETYVSGPALSAEGVWLLRSGRAPMLNEIVEGDPAKVDPRTMGLAADRGDAAILQVIRRMAGYLAIGIANTIVTLSPDLVVIGGGVSNLGPVLINNLRDCLKERVSMLNVDDIPVKPSRLGDRAGVLGAGALARLPQWPM